MRVRRGVKDTDYPDVPLGGWAGTITEIHTDGICTIRWTEETLASIHPVFQKRCEKDGLVLEQYWIGVDDLEPDTGSPLEIEPPAQIATKALSSEEQDDRVRMVFGLTSNDPLPAADTETLATYHGYLSKHLAFPFTAQYVPDYGNPEQVNVIGLGDPDDELMIDETYGILCEARRKGRIVPLPLGELDKAKGNRNQQLTEDYCYWFWNWR